MASESTEIGIAVVESADCFLVGTRAGNSTLPGKAEFPGGKLETDETSSQCAEREAREETGIEVEAKELICRSVAHYEHDTVELHFWRCVPIENAASPSPPFRWTPRAELSALDFPSGNDEVLRRLSADG